ncbi:MAG: homocysteine S-methyltransferase family protein [Clostridia bacterium]|nr:homocysteine S-methyltransferase family protein [Clostridia bacterium]
MKLKDYVKTSFLYLDGGMGTLLQARGLAVGELPERWNLTHPEEICAIHRAYAEAGSQVVSTNTFGANCLKFSLSELDEIVGAAVKLARRATEGLKNRWVALDIGPTGKMLKPYGDLAFEDAVAVFAETVRLGVKHGVDLIFIETMNDAYETKAALLAAKENCDLPVFVSNAYGMDGKLMTGASAAAMVALLEGMGADAIGVNCSLGPKALAPVVREYLRYASVPVLVKPNAGLPVVENGKTVYGVSPETFAEEVAALAAEGVRVMGGCCGTTPAYIAATVAQTSHLSPLPLTEKKDTLVSSYTHAVFFDDTPVLIGERINPTGKKLFKEALRRGDMEYILKEGLSEEEKGVHILDVNVGLPEIDERQMLSDAVRELQAVTALPLQIDTADSVAMEAALRIYNGKAMINSVNGKKESLDAVLPLAKKYGGVLVALTLDENGIPETAEGRFAIAERILKVAETYGIAKKNIVFDPLALTVSADKNAARETLRAVRMIREKLGCHTSLGVSNVSFGLPERDAINSTFFALALENGLSAAIMNPHSAEMMKVFYAFRTLGGKDENCAAYVAFATALPKAVAVEPASPVASGGETEGSPLFRAIVKGLKESAATLTREAVKECDPLAVVNEEIIPALNHVGDGFEKKTVFLPALLMSAEAAKSAFTVIKESMSGRPATVKCPFVLATVKGDIHDIGKNIVRLLLENYGFAVSDLGKDVSPEAVVEETLRLKAPLVGLSALMTTTVPAMEETIRILREKAPFAKIVVGGAVLTEEYATAIGADKYASDAMETVRYAEETLKNL